MKALNSDAVLMQCRQAARTLQDPPVRMSQPGCQSSGWCWEMLRQIFLPTSKRPVGHRNMNSGGLYGYCEGRMMRPWYSPPANGVSSGPRSTKCQSKRLSSAGCASNSSDGSERYPRKQASALLPRAQHAIRRRDRQALRRTSFLISLRILRMAGFDVLSCAMLRTFQGSSWLINGSSKDDKCWGHVGVGAGTRAGAQVQRHPSSARRAARKARGGGAVRVVACARWRGVPPTTKDLFGARPRALAPHADRVPPRSSSHSC